MSEEENIYTHIEDTMSNIYLNGNMLNSGTVMVWLEEKDQHIKELEQQLAIYKRALELACEKYINVDGISYVLRDNEDYFDKSDEQIQKETIDYFVSQAKKRIGGN